MTANVQHGERIRETPSDPINTWVYVCRRVDDVAYIKNLAANCGRPGLWVVPSSDLTDGGRRFVGHILGGVVVEREDLLSREEQIGLAQLRSQVR